jgi:electron transfer flavoprotein alpha subunit
MRIAVCIKQVPVVSALQFDAATKTLRREGVRNEVSPFDIRALLKAIELREAHGGEVVAITMGPPSAREALAECLALGADRGLHLCDRAFAGADTLATARALAAALRREPFDLILCGRNSVDAETGQVGPELAELLDLPQVTVARTLDIDVAARTLTAERETDVGLETVSAPLPAVVTAAEDIAAERFTTNAERAAAQARPIASLTVADLGGDPGRFGVAGSPTWVLDLEVVEDERRREIIAATTPDGAVHELVERLIGHGLFATWTVGPRVPPSNPAPALVRRDGNCDVLVVAEQLSGTLRPVTLELLCKASELAGALGGTVAALIAGADAPRHIDTMAAHGAQRIWVADGEAFTAGTESFAAVLSDVIAQARPGAVLLPATTFGRDVAPRVAARLGLGLTGECIDLSVDAAGRVLQHKPAFGGGIVARIASRSRPEMATVRPGMLAAATPDAPRRAVVRDVAAIPVRDRVRVISRLANAASAADLEEAAIVVGFGKGIGGPENMPVIRSLADVLGAALCTTRDVTDAGWLPKQYQVGVTGRAIAPQLYVAIAVRGAFEHMVGVRRAGLIVAINRSAKAPIFKSADYGLIGDYADLVPRLSERLGAAKRAVGGL